MPERAASLARLGPSALLCTGRENRTATAPRPPRLEPTSQTPVPGPPNAAQHEPTARQAARPATNTKPTTNAAKSRAARPAPCIATIPPRTRPRAPRAHEPCGAPVQSKPKQACRWRSSGRELAGNRVQTSAAGTLATKTHNRRHATTQPNPQTRNMQPRTTALTWHQLRPCTCAQQRPQRGTPADRSARACWQSRPNFRSGNTNNKNNRPAAQTWPRPRQSPRKQNEPAPQDDRDQARARPRAPRHTSRAAAKAFVPSV